MGHFGSKLEQHPGEIAYVEEEAKTYLVEPFLKEKEGFRMNSARLGLELC